MKVYKVGVKTRGDIAWCYSGTAFTTREAAEQSASDLAMRWTAVQETTVTEFDELPPGDTVVVTRWIAIVGYCDDNFNYDTIEKAFGPFEDRHNACAKGLAEKKKLPHKEGLSCGYDVVELEEP